MVTPDFSFENDIAPAASNFFAEIGGDSRLSAAKKVQLQGKLLDGTDAVQKARSDLMTQRTQEKYRRLQLEEGVSELADARARRARVEQEAGRVAGIQSQVKSIVNSGESAEEKRVRLANLELENATLNNPAAKYVFDAGNAALPKTQRATFSPEQIARFAEEVPPEVIATGDPMVIGAYMGESARRRKEHEESLNRISKQGKEAESEKSKLLDTELEFDDPDEPTWMKPQSTADAELVVDVFGTPEEKAKFSALKSAKSDSGRAMLVMGIQNREKLNRLKSVAPVKADGTGLPRVR